ncbi:type III effector [Marinomonas agarivorans]|nr:type III effector [Marinomonas agarivorans]
MMTSQQLIQALRATPANINFSDVINTIEKEYDFTPTYFKNGTQINNANENNGSCKILAFAKLHNLDKTETLQLFGDYYRLDVLNNPTGIDHQNIRQFMQHGWEQVSFDQFPIAPMK